MFGQKNQSITALKICQAGVNLSRPPLYELAENSKIWKNEVRHIMTHYEMAENTKIWKNELRHIMTHYEMAKNTKKIGKMKCVIL